MNCVICLQPFGTEEDQGVSQFAAYGGLPSPCCEHCFEANDYSIKNREQLKIRSLQRRVKAGQIAVDDDGNDLKIEPMADDDLKQLESLVAQFT